MPDRAIIKPTIYSEWRFSCACLHLLENYRVIGFLVDLVDFGEFALKSLLCGIALTQEK